MQKDAENLSSGQVANCMVALYNDYTLTERQKQQIIDDRKLFKHFVKLDSLIKGGLVKVRTTPTRYIASILFKKVG